MSVFSCVFFFSRFFFLGSEYFSVVSGGRFIEVFFLVPLLWLLFPSVLTIGTISLLLLELYGSTLAMAMRFECVQGE